MGAFLAMTPRMNQSLPSRSSLSTMVGAMVLEDDLTHCRPKDFRAVRAQGQLDAMKSSG